MRKLISTLGVCLFAVSISLLNAASAAEPKNPMNAPDELAWQLFLQVNASVQPGTGGNALFETWASDHDTFQLQPQPWPVKTAPLALKVPALRAAARALSKGHAFQTVQVVPGATDDEPSEETRRNKEAYNYIVANKLFTVSGLKAAFGKTMNFPVDSLEVKANWYPVVSTKDPKKSGIPGYTGALADTAKVYHVSTASDGVQYALVAMHVISKQVPNWTWATFEHKNNPSRCDILGCKDPFGAAAAYVAPNPASGQGYADCKKTPALAALYAKAKIDPAFANYCLKGTQTDFTTATGQAVRLGNSVTENGFVNQSSCMTCHSRAAFDHMGKATTGGGFDRLTRLASIGPVEASWFAASTSGNPPYAPIVVGQSDLTQFATQADFVWSIPFCAVDDTVSPVPRSGCSGK
ncbi:hypothetical protein GTP81_08590 [Rugamonas sp. FT107W]|uniref:Cytochrome c domain-containing protein n=1 Tax=Duganella vulcania TaxID=2692166 RepID=A0A845HDT6_9BURK|nr:hypothetical protein [Duganella vulcania]MYN16808.1 hypothetical protein [Duganella vulcania]